MGLLSAVMRDKEHQELERLIQEFLSKGGIIQQIPFGKRTLQVKLSKYDLIASRAYIDHTGLAPIGEGSYRKVPVRYD